MKGMRTSLIENTSRTIAENHINIIGLLPKSKNKNAIVVIVDQFTKMIRLKAITTTVSSEKIAKIYKDNIWKIHRILRKILSNRS